MDLPQKQKDCYLCSKPSVLTYKDYPGYQLPTVFDIYYCASCNTSFSTPHDQEHGIYDLIYKNGSAVRWYDRYWKYSKVVKEVSNPLNYLADSEDTYWGVRESIRKITKEKGFDIEILEIGCGLGYLTYSLNQSGYNSRGLDISKEAVSNARNNFGDYYIVGDVHEYAVANENKYDVIVFTELIEHLTDIFVFMESLRKLLKIDGKIILTTPNKSFYPKEVIWATDLPPVHYWWLSEDSIKYIAARLNLNVSFVDFSSYYSSHFTSVNLKNIPIPITPPVFDEEGNLLDQTANKVEGQLGIKEALKKFTFIRWLSAKIHWLRSKSNTDLLIPNKRGLVICAVLDKKADGNL